jgi:hypothetical protein
MLFAILVASLLQDDAYRIQVELTSVEENGKPVFVISGLTDLPNGTLLYVDLFRAGTQEGTQLGNGATRVENKGFRHVLSVFPAKNPAGRFYVRVRFDLKFQDRKDAGEAIVQSNRKTSAKGEAWLDVGAPGDLDKEYRQQCLALAAEMDAMEALAKTARDKYASMRGGENPIEWKKQMTALKGQVSEIEHRNSEKVINRYFDLSEVSDIGLEHLRNQVWALVDAYLRAAGSDTPQAAEKEAGIRLETIGSLVRLLKNKMNLPRVPSTDLKAITVDLKGALDETMRACQAAVSSKERAGMIAEQRKNFETSLMDLAYVVPSDRYEHVQDLAQLANALYDTLTRSESLDEPRSLQDVTTHVEQIEKLIKTFDPSEK